MTTQFTSPVSYSLSPSERALLGFSLRLHLLHRSLLRASLRSPGLVPGWTAEVAEVVRDLRQDFLAMTDGTLERPFAAMHGKEMRRWEAHLARSLARSASGAGHCSDLSHEMEGLLRNGEDFLPFLRNGSAKELSLMLSHFRRSLSRLKEAGPKPGEANVFPQNALPQSDLDHGLTDWNEVLTAVWHEQSGEFVPVKRGSWRCLETAIRELAGVLLLVRRASLSCEAPVGQVAMAAY